MALRGQLRGIVSDGIFIYRRSSRFVAPCTIRFWNRSQPTNPFHQETGFMGDLTGVSDTVSTSLDRVDHIAVFLASSLELLIGSFDCSAFDSFLKPPATEILAHSTPWQKQTSSLHSGLVLVGRSILGASDFLAFVVHSPPRLGFCL